MPTSDVDVAIAAAEAGGAVVRSMYRTPMDRYPKSPTDFATAADISAERAIIDVVRKHRPSDMIVGEESGSIGSGGSRRWLVDPLCGTLNFAAETPLAVVNVAVREGDEYVAAASVDPIAGETFWTDGNKTWSRHFDSVAVVATPSARSHIVDVNLDPPWPNAFKPGQLLADTRFAAQFRPRVLSTTLALVWVAVGRRAAYVTDGDMRENVHFASGVALCRAAGCVITGLGGEPVESGVTGLIAAADESVHARLLELLR